jgi:hypothetical protein
MLGARTVLKCLIHQIQSREIIPGYGYHCQNSR